MEHFKDAIVGQRLILLEDSIYHYVTVLSIPEEGRYHFVVNKNSSDNLEREEYDFSYNAAHFILHTPEAVAYCVERYNKKIE